MSDHDIKIEHITEKGGKTTLTINCGIEKANIIFYLGRYHAALNTNKMLELEAEQAQDQKDDGSCSTG